MVGENEEKEEFEDVMKKQREVEGDKEKECESKKEKH